MLRHPVVPDHDGALSPLDAGLEVRPEGQMLIQKLEDGVGFFLFEAYDVASDFFFFFFVLVSPVLFQSKSKLNKTAKTYTEDSHKAPSPP